MRLIHRLKHWQIFIFLFLIPLLFEIFAVVVGLLRTVSSVDTQEMFSTFKYFPIIILVPVITIYSWLWSIGIGLRSLIPESAKLSSVRFKLAFVYSLLYFVVILIAATILLFNLEANESSAVSPSALVNIDVSGLIPVIVPLHVLAVFCLFHCFYFCAKTFKSVVMQRTVIFSDFAAEFFLLWFSIIGVWVIQPKINKLS